VRQRFVELLDCGYHVVGLHREPPYRCCYVLVPRGSWRLR
jgi:hypothetical protein